MSFTGILTYWLVVGLYQSVHFYQAALERQTIAAQLETQLSHAELENLKSQLHPHFLFNSLHSIGVLMQEDVDAASICWSASATCCAWPSNGGERDHFAERARVRRQVSGDRTDTVHDRLKVHMDVPPDLLGVYVPSLALQPLVENAIKHGISVDSVAGRLEIAVQRHNGRIWLCVRDDGPGPAPGSRLRFGVGLTNVQSRLKQLYGDESSLELTGATVEAVRPSSPFHCGVRMKTRVLIVDDEPIARRGIRHYLAEHDGIEVVGEAANGISAVEQIMNFIPTSFSRCADA